MAISRVAQQPGTVLGDGPFEVVDEMMAGTIAVLLRVQSR
jgi:hypothetical protein